MLGYVPELRKDKSLQVTQETLNIEDTEDANSIEEKVLKIRIKLHGAGVFYRDMVLNFRFFKGMIPNL